MEQKFLFGWNCSLWNRVRREDGMERKGKSNNAVRNEKARFLSSYFITFQSTPIPEISFQNLPRLPPDGINGEECSRISIIIARVSKYPTHQKYPHCGCETTQ